MKIVSYEKSDKGYFYKKVKENNEIKKIRITADEYSKHKKIQKGGGTPDQNAEELNKLINSNIINTSEQINSSKNINIIDFINKNKDNINYFYNNGIILDNLISNIKETFDYTPELQLNYNNKTNSVIISPAKTKYCISRKRACYSFHNGKSYDEIDDDIINNYISEKCNIFILIYSEMIKENNHINYKNIKDYYLEKIIESIKYIKYIKKYKDKYNTLIYYQLINLMYYINPPIQPNEKVFDKIKETKIKETKIITK